MAVATKSGPANTPAASMARVVASVRLRVSMVVMIKMLPSIGVLPLRRPREGVLDTSWAKCLEKSRRDHVEMVQSYATRE